jgi:hypothetical protein
MWKKIRELFIGGNAETAISDEIQNAIVQEFLVGEAIQRQAARDARRAKPKRHKRALPSLFDDEVASEIKQRLTAYKDRFGRPRDA